MILITGGSGQVGTALRQTMDANMTLYDAPNRTRLCLDDPKQIFDYCQSHFYTGIIHLAAETNVDYCEKNQALAEVRNSEATRTLAIFAASQNIPIIFVSSSAVLSGDGKLMHKESAEFSPSNFYGYSKMLAENYITDHCQQYLIIRASWMLGTGSRVKKFAEIAFEKIKAGENFSAVYDKFGSLTSAVHLADLIYLSLSNSYSGTVHYSSHTPCSRYDVAKHIKNILRSTSTVTPIESSKFPLDAPRGFSEGLIVQKIESLFALKVHTWEEELNSFLEGLTNA